MREAFIVDVPRPAALRAINYRPEVEAFRRHPEIGGQTLGLLTKGLGASYWQVFTRIDCSRSHGVELLTQADMFAAEPEGRIIRRDSMPRPDNHLVRPWQILIAGAGQMKEGNLFGRSIIADGRLSGGYLGPHAVALTFEEEGGLENLWTYAFLNTEVGLAAIRSCAFGTSVPGLRLDLLADLPVPIPSDGAIMKQVAELVRETVECRQNYAHYLQRARLELEELPEMQEAAARSGDRSARCQLWRGDLPTLRAWNYVSAGNALSYLRSCWKTTLEDLAEPDGVRKGGRFARVAVQHPLGRDLLSQRDVFMMRPVPRRIAEPGIGEDLSVGAADLFIASRGQTVQGGLYGRTELSGNLPMGAVVSEDFVRVTARPGMAEVLQTFLSTGVGRALARTTAYGTSIPGMRLDLLRALPVPELADEVRVRVSDLAQRSVAARSRARYAEAEAIRLIEEEALPQWLG